MTPHLDLVLAAARDGVAPASWVAAAPRIAEDRARLEQLLASGGQGYGVTTRVGHRDDERLEGDVLRAFQEELLATHRLPAEGWADVAQVRAITATKAQHLSMGGSGVSSQLYAEITAAAVDPTCLPPVPLDASYSSGDVIPGAWWATGVLAHVGHQRLGAKEALALCNGAFVHVGASVELHRTVGRLAAAVRTLATSALVAGGAKLDAVLHAEALGRSVLDVPSTSLPPPPARTAPGQDPVAVRATPEVLAALELTLAHLADALDAALGAPSDNPIVGEEAFLEQASFLAPGVAIATSGVIEVLLLTATWTERMIHWLCSGEAGALPEDLRVGAGLGLIQVPKLATAWVEGMRMAHGRRTLASGSSTSHEIEDLWTNGLHATVDADAAAVRLCRLLALLATAVDVAHDLGAPVIETSWDRARGDLDERTHLHLDQIDRHLDRDRTLVVPDGG